MKSKIYIALIMSAVVLTSVSAANAQITLSLELRDMSGNDLLANPINGYVPLSTVVNVTAIYSDPSDPNRTSPATCSLDVYFNQSGVWIFQKNLFNSTLMYNGDVKSSIFTLTKLGQYEFRFNATRGIQDTGCPQEIVRVKTLLRSVVPEPGTLVALALGLSVLGLFQLKRRGFSFTKRK